METQIKIEPDRMKKGTKIQKITPFLWFDNQAEDAVNFYVSAFKNSEIKSTTRYSNAVGFRTSLAFLGKLYPKFWVSY